MSSGDESVDGRPDSNTRADDVRPEPDVKYSAGESNIAFKFRSEAETEDLFAATAAFHRWRRSVMKANFRKQLQDILSAVDKDEAHKTQLQNEVQLLRTREQEARKALAAEQGHSAHLDLELQSIKQAYAELLSAAEEAQQQAREAEDQLDVERVMRPAEKAQADQERTQMTLQLRQLQEQYDASLRENQLLLDRLAEQDAKVVVMAATGKEQRQVATSALQELPQIKAALQAAAERAASAEGRLQARTEEASALREEIRHVQVKLMEASAKLAPPSAEEQGTIAALQEALQQKNEQAKLLADDLATLKQLLGEAAQLPKAKDAPGSAAQDFTLPPNTPLEAVDWTLRSLQRLAHLATSQLADVQPLLGLVAVPDAWASASAVRYGFFKVPAGNKAAGTTMDAAPHTAPLAFIACHLSLTHTTLSRHSVELTSIATGSRPPTSLLHSLKNDITCIARAVSEVQQLLPSLPAASSADSLAALEAAVSELQQRVQDLTRCAAVKDSTASQLHTLCTSALATCQQHAMQAVEALFAGVDDPEHDQADKHSLCMDLAASTYAVLAKLLHATAQPLTKDASSSTLDDFHGTDAQTQAAAPQVERSDACVATDATPARSQPVTLDSTTSFSDRRPNIDEVVQTTRSVPPTLEEEDSVLALRQAQQDAATLQRRLQATEEVVVDLKAQVLKLQAARQKAFLMVDKQLQEAEDVHHIAVDSLTQRWKSARDSYVACVARHRDWVLLFEAFHAWKLAMPIKKAHAARQELSAATREAHGMTQALRTRAGACKAYFKREVGMRKLHIKELALLSWYLQAQRQVQARHNWNAVLVTAFACGRDVAAEGIQLHMMPALLHTRAERSFIRRQQRRRLKAATSLVQAIHNAQVAGLVLAGWRAVTWVARTAEGLVQQDKQLEALSDGMRAWVNSVGNRRYMERAWVAWRLAVVQTCSSRLSQHQLSASLKSLQSSQRMSQHLSRSATTSPRGGRTTVSAAAAVRPWRPTGGDTNVPPLPAVERKPQGPCFPTLHISGPVQRSMSTSPTRQPVTSFPVAVPVDSGCVTRWPAGSPRSSVAFVELPSRPQTAPPSVRSSFALPESPVQPAAHHHQAQEQDARLWHEDINQGHQVQHFSVVVPSTQSQNVTADKPAGHALAPPPLTTLQLDTPHPSYPSSPSRLNHSYQSFIPDIIPSPHSKLHSSVQPPDYIPTQPQPTSPYHPTYPSSSTTPHPHPLAHAPMPPPPAHPHPAPPTSHAVASFPQSHHPVQPPPSAIATAVAASAALHQPSTHPLPSRHQDHPTSKVPSVKPLPPPPRATTTKPPSTTPPTKRHATITSNSTTKHTKATTQRASSKQAPPPDPTQARAKAANLRAHMRNFSSMMIANNPPPTDPQPSPHSDSQAHIAKLAASKRSHTAPSVTAPNTHSPTHPFPTDPPPHPPPAAPTSSPRLDTAAALAKLAASRRSQGPLASLHPKPHKPPTSTPPTITPPSQRAPKPSHPASTAPEHSPPHALPALARPAASPIRPTPSAAAAPTSPAPCTKPPLDSAAAQEAPGPRRASKAAGHKPQVAFGRTCPLDSWSPPSKEELEARSKAAAYRPEALEQAMGHHALGLASSLEVMAQSLMQARRLVDRSPSPPRRTPLTTSPTAEAATTIRPQSPERHVEAGLVSQVYHREAHETARLLAHRLTSSAATAAALAAAQPPTPSNQPTSPGIKSSGPSSPTHRPPLPPPTDPTAPEAPSATPPLLSPTSAHHTSNSHPSNPPASPRPAPLTDPTSSPIPPATDSLPPSQSPSHTIDATSHTGPQHPSPSDQPRISQVICHLTSTITTSKQTMLPLSMPAPFATVTGLSHPTFPPADLAFNADLPGTSPPTIPPPIGMPRKVTVASAFMRQTTATTTQTRKRVHQ